MILLIGRLSMKKSGIKLINSYRKESKVRKISSLEWNPWMKMSIIGFQQSQNKFNFSMIVRSC